MVRRQRGNPNAHFLISLPPGRLRRVLSLSLKPRGCFALASGRTGVVEMPWQSVILSYRLAPGPGPQTTFPSVHLDLKQLSTPANLSLKQLSAPCNLRKGAR